MSGHTVHGVGIQITEEFLSRYPPAAPWTAKDTLFSEYQPNSRHHMYESNMCHSYPGWY
jgi:hypothetical protein